MKQVSGKDLCKILEKHGCILKRTQGSHFLYEKSDVRYNISVPVHGNTPLKLGLLKNILKIAGLTESDL